MQKNIYCATGSLNIRLPAVNLSVCCTGVTLSPIWFGEAEFISTTRSLYSSVSDSCQRIGWLHGQGVNV